MIRKTTNKDLTAYNTFRMNVKCRSFIEYDSIADLIDIDFGTPPQTGEAYRRRKNYKTLKVP